MTLSQVAHIYINTTYITLFDDVNNTTIKFNYRYCVTRQYRYTSYRQGVRWVYGILGKHIRVAVLGVSTYSSYC